MSKALSLDLRTRVLAAVQAGASHREAAARFGVSPASVSRWRALERAQGDARPGPLGGDRRSGQIEAQAPLILALIAETPDATNAELRAALAERGHRFGYGTLQRFFRRHRITRKKDRPCQRAGSPGRRDAAAGLVRWTARARACAAGLRRRDLGEDQHGPLPRALPARRAAAHGSAPRPLEDQHIRRRPDPAGVGRALRLRRPDQPGGLRDLGRAGSRPRVVLPPFNRTPRRVDGRV